MFRAVAIWYRNVSLGELLKIATGIWLVKVSTLWVINMFKN